MFSSAALLLLVAGLAMCSGYMFNRGLKTVTRYDIALNEQLGIVTMYMKETCPFCKEAKVLLVDKYGLKLSLVDVEEPDSEKRQNIIQQMITFSGRKTVPQIFFNAEHIGGNDDVQNLEKDGSLVKKVEEVKTTAPTMMMDNWYHPWY